jgi:type I protein arginine methyltransferase
VASNGLSDKIEVIQSAVEDLELPCQVDIIISEWMGYFLLRESMLDSVLRARNKWLKPEGAMFPSNATMYFSAITNESDRENKMDDYMGSLREWNVFIDEMKEYYNVDMGVIEKSYIQEQSEFHIYSSLWTELSSEHVIGQPVIVKRFDLNTCTIEEVQGVDSTPYSVNVPFPIRVSGFAGWFTVDFAGSVGTPAQKRITLSTGPEMGYTHWGQQVFYLKNAIDCTPDTTISGDLALVRQDTNKRLYNLLLSVKVDDGEAEKFTYEMP